MCHLHHENFLGVDSECIGNIEPTFIDSQEFDIERRQLSFEDLEEE